MERPISGYRQKRAEDERLGDLARFLSVLAAILFVLITAQAAGHAIAIPLI